MRYAVTFYLMIGAAIAYSFWREEGPKLIAYVKRNGPPDLASAFILAVFLTMIVTLWPPMILIGLRRPPR